MKRSRNRNMPCRPFTPGWWVRLGALVLFIGSVHYGRVHLVLEPHLSHPTSPCGGDLASSVTLIPVRPDTGDGHEPHLVTDHSLRLAQAATGGFLTASFLAPTAFAETPPPTRHYLAFLVERQNPPGHPTPDPLRPRGPPLA